MDTNNNAPEKMTTSQIVIVGSILGTAIFVGYKSFKFGARATTVKVMKAAAKASDEAYNSGMIDGIQEAIKLLELGKALPK